MLKLDQLAFEPLSLMDPFDILAKHGELTLVLHSMEILDG